MTTSFENLLRDIATAETGQPLDAEALSALQNCIERGRLDSNANVPAWLTDFFTALRGGQSIPKTALPTTPDGFARGEFFAALQELDPFDFLYYGEWARVRLPRLGMLGFISLEQGFYLVMPLAQAPDDRISDLSEAKWMDRPLDAW